jgi:cell division protein FtsB
VRWVRFWAIFNGALVVLLIGAALFGSDGVVRHEQLSDEVRRTESLNEKFSIENDRLRLEAAALRNDPGYVEEVIRDELGYVGEKELIYIFPAEPSPQQ